MKLIIGLGNPGEQYNGTRHNLGFEVLDEYAKKNLPANYKWEVEEKFKSEIIKLSQDIWLVKPQTYMNNSGMGVRRLADYFKIPLEDLIVIHDELDLPLGKIKVRIGGSAAGHHGIESIIESLGDEKFIRVRIGIGSLKTQIAERKGAHVDTNKYVLESFRSDERPKVKHIVKQVVGALDLLLNEGLEKAQNQFN